MINLQTIEQMHNTTAIKSGISRFSGCLYPAAHLYLATNP